MPHPLKKAAVRIVKPLVSERTWARLRSIGPAQAPDPVLEPALEPVPGPVSSAAAPAPTQRESRRQRLAAMDLSELARHFKTDKFGVHRYTPHYQRHLEHLRDREFTLLEIGIGGYRQEGKGGASLRMWKHFFPHAQIIGLDIEDKSFISADRITTIQGSQVDEALLHRIVEEHGPLEVVIDDGSHRPEHVRETFRILFPLLAPGGVYAIEDTQTSYWPEWGGSEDRHDPATSMALVKDLVDGLNYEEYVDEAYEPTYTDLHVVGVHAFHNLVILEKGDNREGSNRRRMSRTQPATEGSAPASE